MFSRQELRVFFFFFTLNYVADVDRLSVVLGIFVFCIFLLDQMSWVRVLPVQEICFFSLVGKRSYFPR